MISLGKRIGIALLLLLVATLLLLAWSPWTPLAWKQDFRGMPFDVAVRVLGWPTVHNEEGESVWAVPVHVAGLSVFTRQLVLTHAGPGSCIVSQSEVTYLRILLRSEQEARASSALHYEQERAARGQPPIRCEATSPSGAALPPGG